MHHGLRLLAVSAAWLPLACSGSSISAPVDSGADSKPRCVIFFEGGDCDLTQSRSSCCTGAGEEMTGCWEEDEARSMKVYGPKGTVITVFDHPKASTQDDYFVLRKEDDRPICVGSFERARESLPQPAHVQWFYSGGNGLDGKVSTFGWYDPRQR